MNPFWGAFLGGAVGACASGLAGVVIGMVYVYIKRLQLQRRVENGLRQQFAGDEGYATVEGEPFPGGPFPGRPFHPRVVGKKPSLPPGVEIEPDTLGKDGEFPKVPDGI